MDNRTLEQQKKWREVIPPQQTGRLELRRPYLVSGVSLSHAAGWPDPDDVLEAAEQGILTEVPPAA